MVTCELFSKSFVFYASFRHLFLFSGDREQTPGTASDIYSFGIAALETAALDIQSVAPAAAVAAASITAAVAASNDSAAGSSG